jgi:hypothetical protein
MSPEFNKPVERLLKAFAEKRRQDAREPLELHPATRRLLQSAVAREYGPGAEGRSPWSRLLLFWLPRLAGAAVIFVGLGILGWTLFHPDRLRRESDFAKMSPDSKAVPSSPTGEIAHADQPRAVAAPLPKTESRSDSLVASKPLEPSRMDNLPSGSTVRSYSAPGGATMPGRAARGPSSPMPPAGDRSGEKSAPATAPRAARATEAPGALELAPAGGRGVAIATATSTNRAAVRLAAQQSKAEAEALRVARESGVGGVSDPREPSAPSASPTTGDAAVARVRASRDALPTESIAPAAVTEGLAKKEFSPGGVADSLEPKRTAVREGEVGALTVPVVTSAVVVKAAETLAAGDLPRLHSLAASDTNLRAQFASTAADRPAVGLDLKDTLPTAQPRFFRQALTQQPGTTAGALAANESSPLVSFSWRQSGQQLQVVDHDGSIYTGEWREVQLVAPASQPADNAMRLKEASADRSSQYAESQAGQVAGTFRVLGTNLTLKQRILFEGSLLQVPEAAAVQRSVEMPSDVPPAPARPAPGFRFESKSVASTNVAASEAQRVSGALRIRARATLGDGRIVPIEAVEK